MFPLRDKQPAEIFPFWVLAIVVANGLVFLFELIAPNTDAFIAQYALIPAQIELFDPGTWKPFVTSQFLHGGFLHIISNMWFLWVFGDNVEERLGFFFFPLFYLTAGVIGALAQYIFIPSSTLPMLGASGAVAGVLGAYFALFPHHRIRTLVLIAFFITILDIPASVMLFYWFFIQLFSGTATIVTGTASFGGVAYFAHIGGFVAGWLVGSSLAEREEAEQGEII